jgi:hypothetical protein
MEFAAHLCGANADPEISSYYRDLFGIDINALQAPATAWFKFLKDRSVKLHDRPNSLPDLIETRSQLDLDKKHRSRLLR